MTDITIQAQDIVQFSITQNGVTLTDALYFPLGTIATMSNDELTFLAQKRFDNYYTALMAANSSDSPPESPPDSLPE